MAMLGCGLLNYRSFFVEIHEGIELVSSIEHSYTKCRHWRKARRKLIRSLYKEGISWQGRTGRKGLAELLADNEAIGSFLEFLKSTEVGGREAARERELEWEQRID